MTIFFPDVSSYTPNVDPAAYPVLLARATLSSTITDPSYTTFKAKAAAAGTVFVAYHWLNHGNLQAQAQHCFSVVGPGVPLMLDVEDEPGNTGYNGPVTVPDIIGFASVYRALGGTASLCYLPFWYWSGAMSTPDLTPLNTAGLHLVSSNYPTAGYTEDGPGWAPYGGATPVQWQFTDTPIDMNAFRGTAAEYAQLVQAPQVAAESIEVEPMFLAIEQSTGKVYLCDGFKSRWIVNETDLNNVVVLWETGALVLQTGVGNTVALASDWQDYGGHPKLIRVGWYPGAYGTVQ